MRGNFRTNREAGTIRKVTPASSGEIVNIMMSTPTSWNTDVIVWLSVCWRLWAMLSMSFVTRLSRSPRGVTSTYDRGSRLILASTSRRSRNMVRCTTPARIHDCSHDSTAEPT